MSESKERRICKTQEIYAPFRGSDFQTLLTLANLRAVQHVGTREGSTVVASVGEIQSWVITSAEENVQKSKNEDIGSAIGTVRSEVLLLKAMDKNDQHELPHIKFTASFHFHLPFAIQKRHRLQHHKSFDPWIRRSFRFKHEFITEFPPTFQTLDDHLPVKDIVSIASGRECTGDCR
jgi:hypothetical protein